MSRPDMSNQYRHNEAKRRFLRVLKDIWFWCDWQFEKFAETDSYFTYHFSDPTTGFSVELQDRSGSMKLVISHTSGRSWPVIEDSQGHDQFYEKEDEFRKLLNHLRVKASKDLPAELPTLESLKEHIRQSIGTPPTAPVRDQAALDSLKIPVENWLDAHADRKYGKSLLTYGKGGKTCQIRPCTDWSIDVAVPRDRTIHYDIEFRDAQIGEVLDSLAITVRF